MKRRGVALALLCVLLLCGCAALPQEGEEQSASEVLRLESGFHTVASPPEIRRAVKEYIDESQMFQKWYGEDPFIRYVWGNSQTVGIFWLEKGENSWCVEINGDLWQLEVKKSLVSPWQVRGGVRKA